MESNTVETKTLSDTISSAWKKVTKTDIASSVIGGVSGGLILVALDAIRSKSQRKPPQALSVVTAWAGGYSISLLVRLAADWLDTR